MSDALDHDAPDRLEGTLREVVETLAPIDRTPCSAGEREAAEWVAERLHASGADVALEDEPSWGTFPPTATGTGVLGMAGAVLVLRKRRTTVNLVGRVGDSAAPATLVVLAHHDAPQTGALFDQTLQRRLHERAPGLLERFKTPLPQWWIGLAGPLATFAGALTARRRFARAGLAIGALGTAAVADIWRSETVQGANDNLSGVASLVALAELLREQPIPGLRVLLVSCGAEETLQDGIRAFVASHSEELDPARTAFVNLDTVGSPHLVMLEAEGPVWMESYAGPWLRDLVEARAERLGVPLLRGFRARASTDSVIPSRAGYAIATLVSVTDWMSPANYHLPSDVPANLDYASVADATRLVYSVAQDLPVALAAGAVSGSA